MVPGAPGRPSHSTPQSSAAGPITRLHLNFRLRIVALAMSKSVPSIPGQTALIERDALPEGSVREPNPIACYADWTAEAEPYLLARAALPGSFTYFDAVKDAPAHVRNAPNRCWPGLYTSSLHNRGVLEYALDQYGKRQWDTSHKPESGGSAVAVWVGVEGAAGGAA